MHVGKAPPLLNVGHWKADPGNGVKSVSMTNTLIKVRKDLMREINGVAIGH